MRREVAKLKLLLQHYAIMSTQAQLFASDQAGKAARTVLVSTSNAGVLTADTHAVVPQYVWWWCVHGCLYSTIN